MHSAPDRVGYGRVLPAKAANSVRPGTPRRGGGIGGRLFLTTLVALPVLATAVWLPYYLAPVGQRVRHPLHELLRPSGDVGQSFGVLALLGVAAMVIYRKGGVVHPGVLCAHPSSGDAVVVAPV